MSTRHFDKLALTLCTVLTIGLGGSVLAPHVAAAFDDPSGPQPVPAVFTDDDGPVGSYHLVEDDNDDEDDDGDEVEAPVASASAGGGGGSDMVSASPSFTG